MEGFIRAPTTGGYTFSTRSDDSSQVWAAPQPNSQNHLVKVAELNGCCRKVQGRKALQWKQSFAYYIRAVVKEGGGGEYLYVGMKVANKEYYPIPLSVFTIPGSGSDTSNAPPGITQGTALKCGAAVCEYQWRGIGGSKVQDLVSSARYPKNPDTMLALQPSGDFDMSMKGDNLGVMMEGFILAPVTAYYTFSTQSDDASEVWVAPRPNSQRHLIKVVELTGCCRKVVGRKQVRWQRGYRYYIRYYVKEARGNEYGKVGMTINNRKEFFPIPLSMFRSSSRGAPPGLTSGITLRCGAAACEYVAVHALTWSEFSYRY